ncbi:unnamed protein product [Protopolystoma xenopodis]|uniref:Pop1 N-terminal domain-containing protein n=1 Tax=Protopolystoma xenopodis TaxID=117903 RepID=A0A3S5A4A7_9PLAT|nr:unnamed protein product [Protopolystoma xenopodis]
MKLGHNVDVLRLASTRAAELLEFERHVNNLTARAITGLQRLPIRLRRRAASHRPNRLPRRLHRFHPVSKQVCFWGYISTSYIYPSALLFSMITD